MIAGTLRVNFLHYWHCGSGQAGEGDLDLVPETEPSGLPYLRGRALRGRLKQAGREQGLELEGLFGREDARSFEQTGQLHLTNARLRGSFSDFCREHFAQHGRPAPEVAALFEDLASTALDGGVAKTGTLRRVRYAVPVELLAEWELPDERLLPTLEACVRGMVAIGKGRRDGYGWCRASLERSEPRAPSAAAPEAAPVEEYELELEMLDEVVFSVSSATTGGHRTHDFVPGSALLGAAARTLFSRLPETEAALALAQGELSFGNGYPLSTSGEPTLPIPLAWHHGKGEDPRLHGGGAENARLNPAAIHSFARSGYEESALGREGRQPVQMRSGFVSADGSLARVEKRQALRTAIKGELEAYEIAKEGALFNHEAIAVGARFRSRLRIYETDPERRAQLASLLTDVFAGRTIRLGRSKGSEYGRARCTLRPAPAAPEVARHSAQHLALLAESDLALVEDDGRPTLELTPAMVGLDQTWSVFPQGCFLRFRRYSLWNAKRGGPDLERQVICQGSVIAFHRSAGPQEIAVRARVGLGQAEGLGRLLAQPALLGEEQPVFNPPPAPAPGVVSSGSNAPRPRPSLDDPFSAWVQERHEEKQMDTQAARKAAEWTATWQATGSEILRKPSQWGRLDEAARRAAGVRELLAELGSPEPRADRNPDTIFGHGRMRDKWTAMGKDPRQNLAAAICRSLRGEESAAPARGRDRLALAAFRIAVQRLAARGRQEKEKAR